MKKESKLYTITFTFVVTFVFVFVLSFLNSATSERVSQNQRLFTIKAILNGFGIEYKNDIEALNIFKKNVLIQKIDGVNIYSTVVEGKKLYGIIFTGNGLWSTISGFVATDENLERIAGVDFISQNETPGLGGRIEENWFKEQFKSEKLIDGRITVTAIGQADENHENGKVDAITGATQTSKAVEKIINEYLEKLRVILGVKQ